MKQVFGVAKIKSVAQMKNYLIHNTRVREDGGRYTRENIDKRLTKHNSVEYAANPEQALARYREAIAGARLRKNGVVATEIVLGASPEYADKRTDRRSWQKLLEAQVQFFKDRHGEENILAVAYHYDEPGHPHAHVTLVPMVTRELKSGPQQYVSHRQMYGGQFGDSILFDLHTELHQKVSRSFGLERGEAHSLARHQDTKEFYAAVNDWKNTKKNDLAKVMSERERVEGRVQPTEYLRKQLDRSEAEKQELEAQNQALRAQNQELQAQSQEMETAFEKANENVRVNGDLYRELLAEVEIHLDHGIDLSPTWRQRANAERAQGPSGLYDQKKREVANAMGLGRSRGPELGR